MVKRGSEWNWMKLDGKFTYKETHEEINALIPNKTLWMVNNNRNKIKDEQPNGKISKMFYISI